MSNKDIEQVVYSGPIIEGLEDNDIDSIRKSLNGLLIDTVYDPETMDLREHSFLHSSVALNTRYTANKVSIRLLGEIEDIKKVKLEFMEVYKRMFKRDITLL